ncbi:MAG: hypothetical protein H0W72_08730 [Planctomycetes bacterium]|nr:hypothetical protein [Planctomycetota bacterium]
MAASRGRLAIILAAALVVLLGGAGFAWWRLARIEVTGSDGDLPPLRVLQRAGEPRFLHRAGLDSEQSLREALVAQLLGGLQRISPEFACTSRIVTPSPDGRPPQATYVFTHAGAWLGLPFRIEVQARLCLDRVDTSVRSQHTELRFVEHEGLQHTFARVAGTVESWKTTALPRLADLVPLLRREPERNLPALAEAP